MKRLILVLALVSIGCGASYQPPPNLSPPARIAWQATRVIKAIDIVRDIAVAGQATNPPVFTEADTRLIVNWHEAALDTIHSAPQGWKQTVLDGLTAVVNKLPSNEQQQVGPYVQLAEVVLKEVVQ